MFPHLKVAWRTGDWGMRLLAVIWIVTCVCCAVSIPYLVVTGR